MRQNAIGINNLIQNTKNMVDFYIRNKEYIKAEELLMDLLSYNPFDHEVLYALSVVKFYQSHFEAAQLLIEKAIKEEKNISTYWYNLGLYCEAMGAYEYSESAYKKAIELNSQNALAAKALAILYYKNDYFDQAKIFFSSAAFINPNDNLSNYFAKFLDGKNENIDHERFLKELFDNRAYIYNDNYVYATTYEVPGRILEILEGIEFDKSLLEVKVLDLGCGTGLIGEKIRQRYKDFFIKGIDISPKMLAMAKERGVYNKLKESSIENFYVANKKNYDCIIAADVFNYIGDLNTIFMGTAKHLKHAASFIFTIEKGCLDADFTITKSTARYSHSKEYIEKLAEKYGFNIDYAGDIKLKSDSNSSIEGYIFKLTLC